MEAQKEAPPLPITEQTSGLTFGIGHVSNSFTDLHTWSGYPLGIGTTILTGGDLGILIHGVITIIIAIIIIAITTILTNTTGNMHTMHTNPIADLPNT